MKELFRSYYQPDSNDFNTLWEKAVFVLDTNVLLGLYRYPPTALAEFMAVLDNISARLWIPHQVGLEYQQNRLSVIAEQVSKFNEVRQQTKQAHDALQNKLTSLLGRHSSIDPTEFLGNLSNVVSEFDRHIEELKEKHPSVHEDDLIRKKLDALFLNSVGDTPTEKILDAIYAEGPIRYKLKRPPGFNDVGKADEVYTFEGLTFRREFGDLIIWKELLAEATAKKWKNVIFITDDEKDDWWFIHSGKTLGPRPELIEEAHSAGIEMFWMYSSSRFLEFAGTNLGASIAKESIDQVRTISQKASIQRQPYYEIKIDLSNLAEHAVYRWLKSMYPTYNVQLNDTRFPDIIMTDNDRIVGYEVKWVRNPRLWSSVWKSSSSIIDYQSAKSYVNLLNLVLILEERDELQELIRLVNQLNFEEYNIQSIIIGVIEMTREGGELHILKTILI